MEGKSGRKNKKIQRTVRLTTLSSPIMAFPSTCLMLMNPALGTEERWSKHQLKTSPLQNLQSRERENRRYGYRVMLVVRVHSAHFSRVCLGLQGLQKIWHLWKWKDAGGGLVCMDKWRWWLAHSAQSHQYKSTPGWWMHTYTLMWW